jgi:hypothetical protein
MSKFFLGILIAALFILSCPGASSAASESDYHYYMSLGVRAFDKGFYDKAILYFEQAQAIAPSKETPFKYIKLIKRFKEGRMAVVQPDVFAKEVVAPDQQREEERTAIVQQFTASPAMMKAKEEALKPKHAAILNLDDTLWARQPNTDLEIETNKTYILQGRNIKQFLAVNEGILEVDRLDQNRISIMTKVRANTFFHIWDDRGRWTFNVKGQLPRIQQNVQVEKFELTGKEDSPPFNIAYSNNWSSIYLGDRIPDMVRTNLNFSQWVGMYGKTPHGDFDASMNFYKYAESTERIGERVGLTNGLVGPFRDFTIRGFDTEVFFSDLSIPGRSFRGVKLESYAAHHNLRYTVFQGQDRAQFLFISPGILSVKKTHIEGASVTLFPDDDHNYTINVGRGYGDSRDNFLKDKVFSAETEHKFNDFKIYGEIASDEDVYSDVIRTEIKKKNYTLNINFRDIDKDYVTLVGRPSDRGEVGGNIRYAFRGEKTRLNSNLDIYRDRFLFNPDKEDDLNVDWNGSFNYPLSSASSWTTGAFVSYTPQLISPHQSRSIMNMFNQRFPFFGGRAMTFSLGQTFQQNRYDKSPASEFDRNSLSAGLRMPLFLDMSFYVNYEYSFVHNIQADDWTYPHVLTTGVDYTWRMFEPLSGRMSLRYRDEEKTTEQFSFLSGEDSIRGSLGFVYRPNRDFEIYLDGNIRSVWTENPDNSPFNDADVRLGLRTNWDTFFRWNPTGIFQGRVFNDINGNTVLDLGEEGIPGIGIKVGDKVVKTNSQGRYFAKVKARKVRVALDISTLPTGYVNSNGFMKDVIVEHRKVNVNNFGLTSQSGVYGVVFIDTNQNNVLDKDDKFVSKAKVILDGKEVTFSDFEGTYSFDNIKPGIHVLELDVNSLPKNCIPLVKIKNEIKVAEGITYVFNIPLKEKAK